jgi:ketosteroid isomerase-like protein
MTDLSANGTRSAVDRFNDALNRHDVDAVMAAMTDDCVFENTWPSPDGERFEGQAAVRSFWENMLSSSPDARFDEEEMIVAGDRCVVRWRYSYTGDDGQRHHLRGIDLFKVRDGLVAEKLAYVKG